MIVYLFFSEALKSAQNIASENLTGLKSFLKDNPEVPAYVLGKDQNRRQLQGDINVMNWNDFIMEELSLWWNNFQ